MSVVFDLIVLLWNGRVLSVDIRLPSVPGRDVIIQRPLLPIRCVKVLAVRSTLYLIVVPEQSSLAQLWKEQFDHVDESARFDCVGDVEAVDISFADPSLEFVCNLDGCTDDSCAETSD
jgi:hypothetical protein